LSEFSELQFYNDERFEPSMKEKQIDPLLRMKESYKADSFQRAHPEGSVEL